AVNYVVAVILTLLVLKPDIGNIGAFLPTWPLFAALGVLLPSVFVIMGKSVEAAGIVKSDAAQRLSLFLPIVAALTLFGEKLSEG
ncbi:EamA/RhaT family transporter, partial [Haemophilus influenzae]|nr:EamA/RhaT family transporter [Haemophilus influenzae]